MEPHQSVNAEKVEELLEELIEEIVDIEEYVREGRPVPRAHRYKYRVNKQHFEVEHPEITGARILEKAGLVPVDQYRLRMKRRHGPPEEIKPDQTVHLRDHGIERFIAQPKEVQDGLEAARHEFTLSSADIALLEGLQLHWETLSRAGRMWVVIYGIPLPAGFHISTADVAIEIAAGYPTAQLDMAFFHPALRLTNGQPVRSADLPDTLRRDKLYVVGEDGYDWSAAMLCPGGCGKVLEMNLLPDAHPVWRVTKRADGAASLQPSVWLKTGCACHFVLTHGRVRWV